ncbi:MAG: DUF1254 domain-containing protein, partial [Phycisphaerae bacterium]|nr:DUF1254 domain-containing protein [Phycisphaerae bacterium]
MTDPGVDFSTTKDFSNETVLKTLARSQGITSTINISKMARGTVYFIYGSYVDTNRVTLTMSGPGQEDLIAEHEETMGANNVWISTFSFADAKDYNTISYHYFNADTDASRARFMGVIIDGSLDPLDPVPADGARVSASSTRDLSWTNLEPTTASDVVVDVYFGTDPNVPATFVKVVDGVNANTVQVDASTVGQTYYWQINSYRDGSTASDPNTGTIYSFTAVDIAPESVVINTPDMMTWWGEPVSLVPAPTVVDDGVSALSYLWTADAPAGIAVSFDEDTAATPDVTIVKEPYSAAVIVNAGFEADQQDEDGWGAKTGWGGTGGNWNPPADSYTGSAVPEGNMCAWTAGTISQVLAETLAPETQYELTVQVGNSMRYDWPEYNVQLLAGGIVLAEDPNLNVSVPRDSWALVTVSFDSTGVDPDLLGQPLEIRLSSLGNYPGDYAELNFDDVRLTADPPFAPTGVQSITLTLAVTDQSNPDIVTDSMMVDVYETACEVSQKGLGLNVKADYNQNCLVNPEDLTTMAVNWLDDTSATDFVVAEPGPAFAGQLGVLDITGINPATGEAWKVGDTYRLAFVSSGTRDAADPNITAYDAFVQAAADAVGLGGATWKCVGSNYGTGASTDYSAIRDANVGRMATEVPTYLLDGTTKLWDAFLSGNPLNTYSMTETGGTYLGNVATGGGRLFGDPTQEKIEHGNSGRVDGA